MAHERHQTVQTGTTASHAQAGDGNARRLELGRHDAGIEQADDLACNPAAVGMGDDVDEISLGPAGLKIGDEMTNFDWGRHVV